MAQSTLRLPGPPPWTSIRRPNDSHRWAIFITGVMPPVIDEHHRVERVDEDQLVEEAVEVDFGQKGIHDPLENMLY